MRLLHDRILCLAAAFPDASIAALDQNEHRFLNRSPLSCVRSASGGTLWSYMTDPTDERHASAPSRTADLASTLPHVWITADHHFGHANIVVYAGRPFSADQQDAEMARRWRTTVPSDEAVLHLGDLVVGGNAPRRLGTRLHAVWESQMACAGQPRPAASHWADPGCWFHDHRAAGTRLPKLAGPIHASTATNRGAWTAPTQRSWTHPFQGRIDGLALGQCLSGGDRLSAG